MIRRTLLLVLLAALSQAPCSAYGAEEAKPAPTAPAANPLPEITVDAAAWKPLFTTPDFAGWRQPVGEWQMVGEVAKDPANEKALAAKPGTGVIYNGPKGRARDLVTADEFGDIALHVNS